jgi:WD40 repeat protein/energy-coupling factor transporter ATP-binding protein EcfA2
MIQESQPSPEFATDLAQAQNQGIQGISVDSSQNVTFNQTQIIQGSIEQVKTRKFIATSPYKGLKSFEWEDKDRFFGRDQFLQKLAEELEQTNFVLLLGASGSGKSSVIRAGVIPWLVEQKGSDLVKLVLTPDQDPFESLYGALLGYYGQAVAQVARNGKKETLVRVVRSLKEANTHWFIFIDQFEELFTTTQAGRRDMFLSGLVQLVKVLDRSSDATVKILATMRSDFLDRLDPYATFVKVTDKHRPLIAQMQLDELQLAIEQPAAQHGVVFEAGLVKQIVDEVQGQAGYLPLLQYTLDLLWQTEAQNGGIEQERMLKIGTYRELGGVRGALQKHVDGIYGALSDVEKLAAQRIFLKLVGIGEAEELEMEWKPIRRRALRSEFNDPLEQQVLAMLVDRSLLVSNRETEVGESTIEIAHEVLLVSWTTLNGWIREHRRAIALRNRLNDDVVRWQGSKSEDELWRGSKLEQVLELGRDGTFKQVLGGFSGAAEKFIEASQGVRDRELRWARRRAIVGFGLAGIAIFLGVVAYGNAQRAERQATVAKLREQAAVVLNWSPTGKGSQALGLAIQTYVQSQNKGLDLKTAESSLLTAIQQAKENNRFQGHTDFVNSVAFSPDGKTIVSGSWDNTLRLWDLQGNSLGQPFLGHTRNVYSVAFSPDGKTIVSGSWDNTLQLWDLQGNSLGQPFLGHTSDVTSVAFSPDGKTVVSGSWDNTLRLWDLQGNSLGQPFLGHTLPVTSVAFSPDGKTIVSGSRDNTLRLWDLQGNSIGQPFQGHTDYVNSVALSPDGKTIISGSSDNTLRLWDLQGNSLGQPFQGHTNDVTSVAFSPDGKTIISGSWDNTLRLWDLQGKSLGQPFQGHTSFVKSVAFSPDGKTIVSSSRDTTVRLWDLQGKSTSQPFQGHTDFVTSVAFSPDSKTIVSGSADTTLRLWDLQGNSLGQPLQGHTRYVNSVAFSPDSKTIVSGSSDNTLRLWDLQGNSLGQPFQGHTDFVWSVAFSPDSKTIVSGSADTTLRLWDLQGNSIGQPFQGHTDFVYSVAFSPDGKTIVSGSADTTLRLWDLQGNSIGQPFQGHTGYVSSVAFSPDGKTIVSGSGDNTLRLWDLQGNSLGQPFQGQTNSVQSVAFSPDVRAIVSGGSDNMVRLWDLQGNPVGQPFQGHTFSVNSVAFSPDSKTIVSGSADGTLRLWAVSLESWFRIACNRLRYHPLFRDPASEIPDDDEFLQITLEARAACQERVWSGAESNK